MPNVVSKPGDYLTDRLTDYAVDFIGEKRDEPFFLSFSYYTVHTPIMAKPELVAKYTNIIFDMHFTMKAILERHSVVALFVAIIFIAAHGGWCYRALERPLCAFWLEDQWDTVAYGWGRCGLQQPTTFENFEDR